MCGIAGIISLSNTKINNGNVRVNNMLKAMSYRGPNGSGVWNDDKEIFTHHVNFIGEGTDEVHVFTKLNPHQVVVLCSLAGS